MKELKDTVDLMLSEDYRDRLKAEYWQASIRLHKLDKTIMDAHFDRIHLDPDVYAEMLRQYNGMREYTDALRVRAVLEGVDLEEDALRN